MSSALRSRVALVPPFICALYFIVSLQFLVYDGVRIALGIGSDDLKLYLNVLGGALQESGGPV